MNLTPIDVEQKAFTQALRGYQMDEVDDFLDEVVGTLRNYEQRLREAHDKIRVLESEGSPASRGGDESEIARAILTAQRSADRLLSEAREEAEGIRTSAAEETSRLAAHRDSERTRLQTEVAGMANLVSALRASLAELSSAVSTQVDAMDNELGQAGASLGPQTEDSGSQLDASDTGSNEQMGTDETTEEETPTFSDIFPEPVGDYPAEAEGKSRVTSRPWERG
jgi:cell division initiation protein